VMRIVRRLAYMWSFNLLALFAAASLVSGISYSDSFGTLAVTALVFAVVNLFLKPAAKLLAFPLILVTLGIALFFINILMLYVTDWIVPRFSITHFGAEAARSRNLPSRKTNRIVRRAEPGVGKSVGGSSAKVADSQAPPLNLRNSTLIADCHWSRVLLLSPILPPLFHT